MTCGADELDALLADRPAATRTVPVDVDVFHASQRDRRGSLRRMTEEEDAELAAHLDVPVAALAGPFHAVDRTCTSCGRRVTFLDFVCTATADGHHLLGELRAVLTGSRGCWITVRGRDGGRPARCAECGTAIPLVATEELPDEPGVLASGDYSEYSSSTYAYV
ncbi:hypothetical protein [Actinomycetospora chiangmaiensis]|uniref:hypothetical protein n=1 Tax=Actinomycetospora chiangmaiensis TaxID=402650 RepID=UPI00036F9457|nr:hypothetical protein [Actinomycetospora chiangmaiensis]